MTEYDYSDRDPMTEERSPVSGTNDDGDALLQEPEKALGGLSCWGAQVAPGLRGAEAGESAPGPCLEQIKIDAGYLMLVVELEIAEQLL